MSTIKYAATFIIITLSIIACNHSTTPKPRGYFRISFPEHEYNTFDQGYPYTFKAPTYAKVLKDSSRNAETYWLNVVFPEYKGIIHLSYKKVNNNLQTILEDNRKLAYKHSIKADAIGERLFISDENKVYGIMYEIRGDAASSIQFFLTDSAKHFIRGSLYFDAVPNKDSIGPVVDFVKEDIMHLMETLEWKN